MTYYKNWALAYNECNDEMKQKSREHWRKVHAENLKDGRSDLYMFSAQILAAIELVDNGRIKDLF